MPRRAQLSRVPESGHLYREIALEVRRRITDGRYPPGNKLPGLFDLVSEFGVSTITVRRALAELTKEGLIYGQKGLGIFVKPKRKIHRVLAGDPSIGDAIQRAGFEPVFEEREFRNVEADEEIAERLQVPVGTELMMHEKLTFADGEAISLHRNYIPIKLAKSLREGLARLFIFELLKEKGVVFTHSRFAFASRVVDQELSSVFHLSVGFPLLEVQYTPIGKKGHPVLTGTAICRADMFVFEVDIPNGGRGGA